MQPVKGDACHSESVIGHSHRRWATWLMIAQVAAAIVAMIAAFYETESIIVTGPIMAATGFAFAFLTRRWRSWQLLAFGLSAPLVAGLGAIIIWVFTLGPSEARGPMCFLASLYAVAALAASFFVYRRITSSISAVPSVRRKWQFSMKSLMIAITGLCLVLAIAPNLLPKNHGNNPYLELAPFAIFSLVVFSLAIRFAVNYRKHRKMDQQGFLEDSK